VLWAQIVSQSVRASRIRIIARPAKKERALPQIAWRVLPAVRQNAAVNLKTALLDKRSCVRRCSAVVNIAGAEMKNVLVGLTLTFVRKGKRSSVLSPVLQGRDVIQSVSAPWIRIIARMA